MTAEKQRSAPPGPSPYGDHIRPVNRVISPGKPRRMLMDMRNPFRRKHFGIPAEFFTFFFYKLLRFTFKPVRGPVLTRKSDKSFKPFKDIISSLFYCIPDITGGDEAHKTMASRL